MRITAYDILEYLASGMSVEEIIADFPECAFQGRWAAVPRDRGHSFHGIVGSHSTPRAVWPTFLLSQVFSVGSSVWDIDVRLRMLSPARASRCAL